MPKRVHQTDVMCIKQYVTNFFLLQGPPDSGEGRQTNLQEKRERHKREWQAHIKNETCKNMFKLIQNKRKV
jgi:hypothetical protein